MRNVNTEMDGILEVWKGDFLGIQEKLKPVGQVMFVLDFGRIKEGLQRIREGKTSISSILNQNSCSDRTGIFECSHCPTTRGDFPALTPSRISMDCVEKPRVGL